MTDQKFNFNLSAIAVAVLGVVLSLSALADEEEAAALKKPQNTIELGIMGTPTTSSKYGEYSGMNRSGAYTIGNIGLRGGSAYDKNEQGGTGRWSLRGDDLGLTSRTLEATAGEQGSWSLGLKYDELSHNLTSGYQTPYVGQVGGNSFTLPGFGLATTSGAGTEVLTATQLGLYRDVDVSSSRKNTTFNGTYALDSRTDYTVEYSHLVQEGAKLMSFGLAQTATNGVTGQASAVLPMPTNYVTDNFSVGMNWRGEQSFVNVSINNSYFRDQFKNVAFTTFAGAATTQLMPTAPDNTVTQVALTGGYHLTPSTKFVGNYSTGVNRQDASFVNTNGMLLSANTPPSLNGFVVNTHADLKLINQTTKALTLSAAYKRDIRDNKTSSYLYNFNAIDGGNTANYPNTPLSVDKSQMELAGDYRIKQDHNVRVSYTHEQLDRMCHQYGVGAQYTATTNCVVAKSHTDNKLEANYRIKPNEDITLRLGYGHSNRNTTSDPYAIAAMIGVNGAIPGPGTTTIKGQNAGDYFGFYPFFTASRVQNYFKGSANWQANEQLDLTVTTKISQDHYPSDYGVQKGSSWSLGLDANYSYSETGLVNGYITSQRRSRDMTNLARNSLTVTTATATTIGQPAIAPWTNMLTDNDLTVGAGWKQSGLMAGKLDLAADYSHSLGKTNYTTVFGYSGATTGGFTCSSAQFLTCGSLPDVRSAFNRLKLTGTYHLDKSTRAMLTYVDQRLSSDDYLYNAYQYGYTAATVLPTNQQTGSYNVRALGMSLIHNF